jgi:hypothetical protein
LSIRVRISSLSTLNMGIRVLHQNQRLLLPLVATMWPSIRKCARDENVAVSCSAMACVCTIAILCGDFIRARFNKELWPYMRKRILKEIHLTRSTVQESDLRYISINSNPNERHHQAKHHQTKHLECLLLTLSVLSISEMLKPDNIVELTTCCCRLLSTDRQVSFKMRECSLSVLTRLQLSYPNLVWYGVSRVFGCNLHRSELRPVTLPSESRTSVLWEGGKKWFRATF